jgi:signal transduction histidine kinase
MKPRKLIVMKDIQFLLPRTHTPRLTRYNETVAKITGGKKIADIIRKTQENERKLIGRELHDNVNQILSTVKLFMGMLQPEKAREKHIRDKSVGYVMMAIEELRKISREMVAATDKETGLAESIQSIIEDIHYCTRMKITFSCHPGIEFLHPDKKIALLRIVQEQLKNIVNYSKAKRVMINLDLRDGNVSMEIKDNGVGFDAAKATKGIGLSNIYERTIYFKGSVDLKTAEGKGCVLSVKLPAA